MARKIIDCNDPSPCIDCQQDKKLCPDCFCGSLYVSPDSYERFEEESYGLS